jgi:MOSC domain-containing protein YiiM
MMWISAGTLRSVNVSPVRTVSIDGDAVPTAIGKTPVGGRVAVRGVNVAGDDQADRANHGGADRALYAYAAEDYAWWSERLGRPLAPGTFGENLTVDGIDVSGAKVGEQWRIGSTLLQVTSPRVPCFKLAHVMGDPGFVKAFAAALRPGAYLRILAEGELGAGDDVKLVLQPSHRLTMAEFAKIYFFERARIHELLDARDLPASWHAWAIEHLR